jgi:hypothetical protein
VPMTVMNRMLENWEADRARTRSGPRICRGTLLSRAQYLVDIEEWGYEDPRRAPKGTMSAAEIARWSEAIPSDIRHNSLK